MTPRPTALIADDEPLLRDDLKAMLLQVWPELDIIATARNGREAVERFEAKTPDVCFLDVRMPVLSGLEVAQRIGGASHVVFVTAYDSHAVDAFTQGAVDYLLKPVVLERLEETTARLRRRLEQAQPAALPEALLQQLVSHLRAPAPAPHLRWLRASTGSSLRMIAIDTVDFLRSDEKYTCIGWRDETGTPAEAFIRTPLKELLDQLDPQQFVQVHRSVAVALRAIKQVVRGENETATIQLIGRADVLPVSRKHVHQFRQM